MLDLSPRSRRVISMASWVLLMLVVAAAVMTLSALLTAWLLVTALP